MKRGLNLGSERSPKMDKKDDKNGGNEVLLLNPMAFYPGFPHIAEQIFQHMDKKSLSNCREVTKSWMDCIDDQNLFWNLVVWNKIVKKKNCTDLFQWSCDNGSSKAVSALFQKSAQFNINWNTKKFGKTPFQLFQICVLSCSV
jgi:hypothetical protein